MVAATLRSLSLPRFALRRDEAAAALAISPSTFDTWVKLGLMPEGQRPRGTGVVLWDAERIRTAWLALIDADEVTPEDGESPYAGSPV